MARFEVTAPDGKRYEVTVADSMSEADVMKYLEQQFKPQGKTAEQQMAEDRETYNPTKGMSTFDKAAAGFGKAIYDTGRGLGQMVGLVDREDVAESRARDQPLMNTGAGIAGNVLGNVAIAAPTALIPGAQSIAGAGLVGAGLGLAQPSTSTAETLKNVGIGGVVGAAVPALVRGAQVGRSFVDPLYQGGRERIIGRTLRNAAGNQADDAMRNMRAAQPLVPGSAPTAAEAAQNPGIAALQRTATASDPVAMNELAMRQAAQNNARLNAIQNVVPDRAAAVAARDQAATGLYNAANPRPVRVTPGLAALMERPAMQTAMQRAQALAQNNGEVFDPNNLTGQGAHYIKMALDDLTNAGPAAGIGGNEIRALQGIRTTFLRELESQIPEYGQARQAYAQMSRPVTQADVLGQVAERATNFRGNLTPAAFDRAAGDQTARAVTGQARATMADVLEPQQADTINNVMADLLRSDFAQTAGRGVGSDTVQKMAFNNMMDSSGLPSALRGFAPMGVAGNLAQRAGNVVYADANQRMAQQLANALLDPQQAAGLMKAGMVTPQMQQLVNAIRRTGAPIGGAAAGSVQALQE